MKFYGFGRNGFSPRNGEVILKGLFRVSCPTWKGFSPRNGEVILKVEKYYDQEIVLMFQSPQWGSNSKGEAGVRCFTACSVSVPAMGK